MNDVAQAVINQNETPGLTYEQLITSILEDNTSGILAQ